MDHLLAWLPWQQPRSLAWAHMAVLLVWVGVWAARVRRGREPVAAGVALVVGALLLRGVLGWAEPHLPVAWFQPLREGFTPTHLREVTGDDLDVGLLRDKVWTWALAWPSPGWRAMMATDLYAGALTVMGVAEAARRGLADAPRRLALALGVALSWGWWVAAASELHAPVVGVYLLVGAWLHRVVVDDREGAGLRAAAWIGEVGCGFALVMLREELLAIAVAALAAGMLHAVAPRLEPAWTKAWDRFWGRPGRAIIVVAFAAAAWAALAWAVPMGALADPSLGKWTWLLRGLHPSSPMVPRLLAVLLGFVAPGLVVAAGIGSAGALRQPLRWAGLPLVMTAMFSAMWVAAHGGPEAWNLMRVSGWEIYRYSVILVPLVWLLAIPGLARLRPAWAIGVACVPVLPLAGTWVGPIEGEELGWPAYGPIDRTSQREVRALLAWTDAHPTCALLTRGVDWKGLEGLAEGLSWWALTPAPRGWIRTKLPVPGDAALADVVAAGAPDAPCVAGWVGLDCGSPAYGGCPQLEGLPEVEAARWRHLPFVHPEHKNVYGDDVGYRAVWVVAP